MPSAQRLQVESPEPFNGGFMCAQYSARQLFSAGDEEFVQITKDYCRLMTLRLQGQEMNSVEISSHLRMLEIMPRKVESLIADSNALDELERETKRQQDQVDQERWMQYVPDAYQHHNRKSTPEWVA